MTPRTSRLVLAVAGLLLVAGGDPRAEVAVRTDRSGQYVATEMVTTGLRGEPVVWGLRGRLARRLDVLNPKGDLNGDLWPVIAESTVAPNYPWVVWSRFNGQDFDLAWSRWHPGGWQPVEPVLPGAPDGNDLDPDLAFDPEGRAFLAWSRQVGDTAQIQLSVWMKQAWFSPIVVSDPGVDSRYPVILGFVSGTLDLEYSTPDGIVVQRVVFSDPDTITDDINPVPYLHVIGTPAYNGATGPGWEDR